VCEKLEIVNVTMLVEPYNLRVRGSMRAETYDTVYVRIPRCGMDQNVATKISGCVMEISRSEEA